MNGMEKWGSSIALLLAAYLQGCSSIRITRLEVPTFIEVGGSGELDCAWEEQNDRIYSIKWYQAAHEFYRYTPTASPPIQVFDPTTLDVDVDKSWGGSVRITNVSQTATGPFHCEVSADGPTFHTASEQANLTVVDLPDDEPEIRGGQVHYSSGDYVDLTCISRRSNPPAHLSFTINNKPIHNDSVDPQKYNEEDNGVTTSYLRLRMTLTQELVRDGQAVVKCKAEIPGAYKKISEEVLMTSRPYQASVLDGATAGCCPPSLSMSGVLSLPLLPLLSFISCRPGL